MNLQAKAWKLAEVEGALETADLKYKEFRYELLTI